MSASWWDTGGSTGGGDTDTNDSTDGTNSGDSSWDAPAVLQDFAAAPGGFILGLVLTPLLGGLEALQLEILRLINLVFVGTGPGTEGTLGLADIGLVLGDLAITVGDTVGSALLTVLGIPVDVGLDLARAAGLPGLLVFALLIAVVVNAYAAYIRTVIEIVLDAIPGGGALIN